MPSHGLCIPTARRCLFCVQQSPCALRPQRALWAGGRTEAAFVSESSKHRRAMTYSEALNHSSSINAGNDTGFVRGLRQTTGWLMGAVGG